ncbi:MAG: hypothetical protein AAGA48_05495 [Myxococcota bacterium]
MARRPSNDDEFGPKGAPGRRLSRKPDPAAKPASSTPARSPSASPPVDPRAPFTPHQADPSTLSGAPDRRPAGRAPWLVLGTGLVTGVTTALLIALVLLEGYEPEGPKPILTPSNPRHIADAGYGGDIVDNEPDPVPDAGPVAPKPGPIKIFSSSDRGFVSIEVDCPSSGFQRRGRFFPEGPGKMAATVQGVPPNEKCRITFQGTEAATTWANAHETRECVSFNPTVCPVQ